MKKTLKIIISIILTAFLLLLAGVSIYSNVQKAKGNTLPMPFGIGTAVTETGSMEPNMPQGSLVFLVRSKAYKVGDVVAFRKPGDSIYTVHRIIDVEGDVVTTCGDANAGSNDAPIKISQIKGKMLFNIPKLGFALQKMGNFISHPITLILIFAIIVTVFYFSFKPKKQDPSIDEIKAEIDRLKQDTKDE